MNRPLRYRLAFAEVGQRLEIVDEALEEVTPRSGQNHVDFYYQFQRGLPVINMRTLPTDRATRNPRTMRRLKREDLNPQQSVLSQRKDPDLYPEITTVGASFAAIQTFREWSFGRRSAPRLAQPADQSSAQLEPDGRYLGLILNEIEHSDAWTRFNECLRRFLPRFQRLSTRIQAGSVQIYLHEEGLKTPVPATRLSDGTIRFIALLAMLLRADTASVICIEEPELGLHPDALDLIAELLVEASTKCQILVTTHSDTLVSALTDHADSVLVCEHLGTGTVMSRVGSDKLKFWLDKYRLGEIWRIGKLGGNL
jgi:predicted ATPase